MLETLEKQFCSLDADTNLREILKRAWDHLVERGLPSKKQEAFQYVPLRDLYAGNFALASETLPSKAEILPHILPECKQSHLVFVNGNFAPELSELPSALVVMPLGKALTSYQAFLHQRLAAGMREESDPFAILNLSFATRGAFAYLPPKCKLEAPLQCVHLITQPGVFASPRLHFFVGKESKLKIVCTFHPHEKSWTNSVLDLALEESAEVELVSTLMQESHAWLFEAVRATLKQNSRLHTASISRGAKSMRQNFHISLTGENAEALLNGLWLLGKEFSHHVHATLDHQAPHTRSRQLFKGVLENHSQSSFEGKILVQPEAQKTEAYQLNNNLMLGERAIAYSKPNLQIFADDVKASHGATVGQLDSAALFYLKTRGIPEAISKRLLVRAFCQEVGAKLAIPSLQEQLMREIEKFYE